MYIVQIKSPCKIVLYFIWYIKNSVYTSTALFIRLASFRIAFLTIYLLGSVNLMPYNSAGRQNDLSNVTKTSSELDDLDRLI